MEPADDKVDVPADSHAHAADSAGVERGKNSELCRIIAERRLKYYDTFGVARFGTFSDPQ